MRAEPYPSPTVRVFTPDPWKLMEVEIEWGFQAGTAKLAFDGRLYIPNGLDYTFSTWAFGLASISVRV